MRQTKTCTPPSTLQYLVLVLATLNLQDRGKENKTLALFQLLYFICFLALFLQLYFCELCWAGNKRAARQHTALCVGAGCARAQQLHVAGHRHASHI